MEENHMRIVFMGTPELSATVLSRLLETDHEIVAAVTQPDRKKGRKGELAMPPVKELALSKGIEVFQPLKARDEDFLEAMERIAPDLIVVAAFGQILPERLLNIPRFGCVNVHTSLLPKYRGASPIQWAVINGDEVTGVTIMYMAKGLDTGDVIEQRTVPVEKKETAESLTVKLAKEGGELLVSVIEKIFAGTAGRTPQNDAEASYVKVIEKSLGDIDFEKSAASIERLVRGLNPWPTAYTFIDGKSVKFWDCDVCSADETIQKDRGGAVPGEVVYTDSKTLFIKTGEGILKVNELQLEGKKRMRTEEFLRGFRLKDGDRFGKR